MVRKTNNSEAAVDAEQFRSDLYFRLHTHHIHVPPLRDRLEDLPLLLECLLRAANAASSGAYRISRISRQPSRARGCLGSGMPT